MRSYLLNIHLTDMLRLIMVLITSTVLHCDLSLLICIVVPADKHDVGSNAAAYTRPLLASLLRLVALAVLDPAERGSVR